MKRRLLAIGCVTLLSAAYIIYGQQRPAPRAVLDQYAFRATEAK